MDQRTVDDCSVVWCGYEIVADGVGGDVYMSMVEIFYSLCLSPV